MAGHVQDVVDSPGDPVIPVGIAPGTVKYHVKNIRAKLGASCRTEVLREAVRRDPTDGDAHFILSVALQQTGATTEPIISPRERGRYQGYIGSVFGAASIGGPLIGGFLVDGPGWRWCFYVGVPIGIVAASFSSAARCSFVTFFGTCTLTCT